MSFSFSFSRNFIDLTQSDFDTAYEEVTTKYYGCLSLWAVLPEEIRTKKRNLLINYLVGWYLADMFPSKVIDVISDGGKPIASKSIGGTSISYSLLDTSLRGLQSNVFGLKALDMIHSSPEMMGVYG